MLLHKPVTAALAGLLLASNLGEASGQISPSDYFGGVKNQGYLDWYNIDTGGLSYGAAIFFSNDLLPEANEGLAVHWNIDLETEELLLAVAARAAGWIGFGIAEAGGMEGADMVIYETSKPSQLTDAYNLKDKFPLEDDCNDWVFVDATETSDGFLVWQGRRKLDTDDTQDRAIRDDTNLETPPHRIIAAWGDGPSRSFHGLHRARGSIRFFASNDDKTLFQQRMDLVATGFFELTMNDHLIASDRKNSYVISCIDREMILAQGVPDVSNLSIVGIERIEDPNAQGSVHHLIVRGSIANNRNDTECLVLDQESLGFKASDVTSLPSSVIIDLLTTIDARYIQSVYAWTQGGSNLVFPENVGFPILAPGEVNAFQLDFHYYNPDLKENLVDNSGVRVYYTDQPLQHKAALYLGADAFILLRGSPYIGSGGIGEHTFTTPSTCTSQALLGGPPVTVFQEQVHMHASGATGRTEVIRNGQVVHRAGVDYFEFLQQGNHAFEQEPYSIESGDQLRTVCTYDNRNGKSTGDFGIKSEDEMCFSVFYYYPRKTILAGVFPWLTNYGLPLPGCEVEYNFRPLESDEDLERSFGVSQARECPVLEDEEGDDGFDSGSATVDGPEDEGKGSGSRHSFSILPESAILALLGVSLTY